MIRKLNEATRECINCREFKLKFVCFFFFNHHAQAILNDNTDKTPLNTGKGPLCWPTPAISVPFSFCTSSTLVLVKQYWIFYILLLNLKKRSQCLSILMVKPQHDKQLGVLIEQFWHLRHYTQIIAFLYYNHKMTIFIVEKFLNLKKLPNILYWYRSWYSYLVCLIWNLPQFSPL